MPALFRDVLPHRAEFLCPHRRNLLRRSAVDAGKGERFPQRRTVDAHDAAAATQDLLLAAAQGLRPPATALCEIRDCKVSTASRFARTDRSTSSMVLRISTTCCPEPPAVTPDRPPTTGSAARQLSLRRSLASRMSMAAARSLRTFCHPSIRAASRVHALSVSSRTEAGPSIASRRDVSSASSSRCCPFLFEIAPRWSRLRLAPRLPARRERSMADVAAARSEISAAAIGVGVGRRSAAVSGLDRRHLLCADSTSARQTVTAITRTTVAPPCTAGTVFECVSSQASPRFRSHDHAPDPVGAVSPSPQRVSPQRPPHTGRCRVTSHGNADGLGLAAAISTSRT